MADKVKPLKPDEVASAKASIIPDEVLECFNQLIAENWDGRQARVTQNEVVARLVRQGFDRKGIFNDHWLDVEDIYRQEGWEVEYDKPGYNESYPAYFVFRRPK